MAAFEAQLSVAERGEACAVQVEPRRDGAAALRGCGISVAAFWHTGALAPLTVLSVATAGAGPLAVLRAAASGEGGPDGGPEAAAAASPFAALHAECLAANKTAVAAPHAPGRELHLVAVPGAPCFWCAPVAGAAAAPPFCARAFGGLHRRTSRAPPPAPRALSPPRSDARARSGPRSCACHALCAVFPSATGDDNSDRRTPVSFPRFT